MSMEAVNVLSLGVKNDGTEDISTIINEATKEHSLFFPKGFYKVSKPIYLKNSVKGDGYSRYSMSTCDHTWLISEIENEDSSIGILNIESGCPINIENISLKCHSHECGLRFPANTQKNMIFVDKVGIFDVRGYGLYEEGRGSRPLHFGVLRNLDKTSLCNEVLEEI